MIVGELSINDKINARNGDIRLLLWANTPSDLTVRDSYGVIGSGFDRPEYICNLFRNHNLLRQFADYPFLREGDIYYPALGYYWNGMEWKEIEGYVPPRFAPGFSWRDEELPFLFIDDEEYYLLDQFGPMLG